jgi:uncharacterized protein YbjT (DUF2867 family)
MKVTVFGATGVVGRALLPLLGDHEVTSVSRSARNDAGGARWVIADAATGDGVAEALGGADVAYYLVHSLGSRDIAPPRRTSHAKPQRRASSRSSISAASALTIRTPLRICAAVARPVSGSHRPAFR